MESCRSTTVGYGSKTLRVGRQTIIVWEIAEALMNDKNEYGVGWNVNIKEVEDGDPYISLKV